MAGTVGSLSDLTNAGFGQAGVSETGAQESNISNLIGSVAPLATSWSGPMVGTSVAYKAPATTTSSGNIFSEFDSFAHSTFNTVKSLGEGALKDMGKSIVSAVTAPGKLGIGMYELGKATYTNHENTATLNMLDSQQKSLDDNYKSGRINLGQYNAEVQDINKQRQQLNQNIEDNEKLITHGGNYATQGDIGTVGDVFAIATAGESESISQALTSGDSAIVNKLLANGSAVSENLLKGGQILDGVMGKISEGLDNAVSWNGLFGKSAEDAISTEANSAATDNIGKGLAPVVKDIANEAQNNAGANATVLQKAKSVAVGLLIKRPLIYNTAVGNAQDFYHEMSTGKYGDAAKEAGLMGLMTLAGGPIGAAMKYGGKIVQGASRQIFAEPSFIDTLSQYVGNKEAKGIYNDLAQRMRDNPEEGERVAQGLKIMEDTNVKASNGSVVGAVQRIVDYHTLSMPDTPLSGMSHHEFVDNLSNLGRIAEEFGKAGDRGELEGNALKAYQDNRYAFGRITASSKNWLAGQLAEADGKSASLMGTEEPMPEATPAIENNVSTPSDQDVQQYASSFGISEDQARTELSQHTPTSPEGQSQLTTTVREPSGTKIAARQQVMQALDEQYGTHTPILNNVTLRNQIDKIVRTVDDTDEMVKQIGQIKAQSALTGVPKDLANDIRKNGYTVIQPQKIDAPYVRYNETNGKLATKFAKLDSDAYGSNYFQKSSQGLPVLKDVGAGLTQIGLSPDSADGAVYSVFNQNLRSNLGEMVNDLKIDVPIGENRVDGIINKLSNYVKSKQSITDMRQLNMKEVRTTLNVDGETAKRIMSAINEAMLKVPLQLRGLGDRIVDYNYKINPFAGKYARIQSVGKFAYNPFFRWQQVTTTEMFAQAEAGGKGLSYPIWNKVVDTFFPGQADQLNNTITALKTNGIFEGGMSGYAAEDQAAGRIGTHLLPSEERSMAGLVNSMAAKAGVDVNTFIQQNPNEVTDTLRSFVQYPKGGNFINSPLARTINVAFFPARYNMKVAGMAARVLSEQNPFVQVAVIQGLLKAHDWLNSNEGLAWRQQNADAIGVFQWVSPLYSLGYVYDILGGKPNSIGEFGSLGGLPFGIVSQLLDAEGVIQINTPYVSPTNGQVLPSYIPKTTLGAASTALQSFIGSLFTYPGAVAGLPSKTGAIRYTVNKFTGASTTKDFNSVTPTNLTPQEKQEQSVWSNGQSGQVSANGNVVNLYKGPNIPVIPPSMRNADLQSRVDANAKPTTSSSTTKKKESDYTPAALPPMTTVNPQEGL